MAKIVVFSDLHAHVYEDFAKPDPEYVNDRFRAQMETLQKVFDIAKEHDATVLFLGDLFHKRSKLEDVVFNNVYKIFAQNEIETHLLRGNHDSKRNTTDTDHWLETFGYLPHVTVHATPRSLSTSGGHLYMIPYSDDVGHLKECIKGFSETQKESGGPSILVGHIGVDGSEVGKHSHRLEGAFELGDLYPEVFDYVALGHYHKRQFLGGTDNVFYVGNTIQTSFSDEGQDKGVFLIDTEKGGKPEFIAIPNKKFVTLTEVPENVQEIVDNNYVWFRLPEEQAKAIEVYKEEGDNVRIETQREYKSETRIQIGVDSTEIEIIEAYTKEHYPEATDLAKEIYHEAMSE